jgi:hypothetical protein
MTTEDIYVGDNDIRRKLEGAELEEFLAVRAEIQKIKEAADAELAERAEAKAALLERLGITADEAALLLG